MLEGLSRIAESYISYDTKASVNRTQRTAEIGHNVRMNEPKDRLREARQAAGFETPSDAARLLGKDVNKNTLISHENGNRDISRKAAQNYAKLFGVEAGWILYGETRVDDRSDFDVPLVSMVSAGNLRAQAGVTEEDIIRRIKVGDLTKGDWIALQVEGDSMNRVAPDGAIILVDRSDDRLIDGRFYIFSLDGGDTTFKMFKRNPNRMQPYSTNADHMAWPADRDDLYVFGRVRRVIHDI